MGNNGEEASHIRTPDPPRLSALSLARDHWIEPVKSRNLLLLMQRKDAQLMVNISAHNSTLRGRSITCAPVSTSFWGLLMMFQ
jgi:hypothetical protein